VNLTEEDTFNKLRRVPYIEACIIYTMACIREGLAFSATTIEQDHAAKDDLLVVGWTIEELNKESWRMEEEEKCLREQLQVQHKE
jgi:hypothetical protein